jgi:lipopolysaccharide transport system permease protein
MLNAARQIALARADLAEGTLNWRTWFVLGNSELKQRYRRSVIGPFWVTLSMLVQAAVTGFLLAFLFKIELARYLPFLCISLVTWTFLTTVINEGANAFIANAPIILQVKRPFWTYLMLTIWRNALIYVHTVVVFVLAALAFGLWPGVPYLLIPFGLLVLVVNAAWMAFAAALLSARFRDVPLLIANAFNALVWLTPVYYHTDQLGPGIRWINAVNPLTHVIEVARAPFLNEVPSAATWAAAIALAVVGWIATFVLFARSRPRLPFWL